MCFSCGKRGHFARSCNLTLDLGAVPATVNKIRSVTPRFFQYVALFKCVSCNSYRPVFCSFLFISLYYYYFFICSRTYFFPLPLLAVPKRNSKPLPITCLRTASWSGQAGGCCLPFSLPMLFLFRVYLRIDRRSLFFFPILFYPRSSPSIPLRTNLKS